MLSKTIAAAYKAECVVVLILKDGDLQMQTTGRGDVFAKVTTMLSYATRSNLNALDEAREKHKEGNDGG